MYSLSGNTIKFSALVNLIFNGSLIQIMVNGEFKCIGSVQHLKNKFSKGFVLQIKKTRDTTGSKSDMNEIKSFVSNHFAGAYLK